ncbi:MAG: DUF4397 domain-containing protein [Acidimicrobiia bacterium]
MSKKLFGAIGAGALALSAAVAGLVAPAGAQTSAATITLIHGIPNTDVDVEAGGRNVFTAFKYSQTQDLSSLAGQTLQGLKVKAAGTSTVAIDAGNVTLPSSGNTTIIAHLDAAGKPTLGVFANDTSTIAAGKGRLIVRHTAAAPAVDIRANGTVAFANVVNGKEGKADLAAGTISADVVPTGASTPVVIGPANLPITAGSALIVYAVGSLDGRTLNVLTQQISGLGAAPARVNTGNSPVDNSSTSAMTIGAIAAMVLLAGGGASLVLARRKVSR